MLFLLLITSICWVITAIGACKLFKCSGKLRKCPLFCGGVKEWVQNPWISATWFYILPNLHHNCSIRQCLPCLDGYVKVLNSTWVFISHSSECALACVSERLIRPWAELKAQHVDWIRHTTSDTTMSRTQGSACRLDKTRNVWYDHDQNSRLSMSTG